MVSATIVIHYERGAIKMSRWSVCDTMFVYVCNISYVCMVASSNNVYTWCVLYVYVSVIQKIIRTYIYWWQDMCIIIYVYVCINTHIYIYIYIHWLVCICTYVCISDVHICACVDNIRVCWLCEDMYVCLCNTYIKYFLSTAYV
jgi:hypothetical protein